MTTAKSYINNYSSYKDYAFCGVTVLCLFITTITRAQESTEGTLTRGIIIDGDTIPHVRIQEVKIVSAFKFKNERQRKRYGKLVRYVKSTLPYARKAAYKLNEIDRELTKIDNEKNRKAFIKSSEKELFAEFEAPLRKMSMSQGRVLIKLIDRETGDTSYNLIKEYKGGFSAFVWQSVARVFGSNLKSEYDEDGDDKMIEHIVILIDNGML